MTSKTACSIAILAGGASRRMGQDKATLLLNGKMMLVHLLEKLPPKLPVFLVSNNPEKHAVFELPVYPDVFPGKGAPGGVYSALVHSTTPYTLCLACDTPLLNPVLLNDLLSLIRTTDAAALVPVVKERYQSLHSIYHQRCLDTFEVMLTASEDVPPIHKMFDSLPVQLIPEKTLRQIDPDLHTFINVNTPEDLRRVENLLT